MSEEGLPLAEHDHDGLHGLEEQDDGRSGDVSKHLLLVGQVHLGEVESKIRDDCVDREEALLVSDYNALQPHAVEDRLPVEVHPAALDLILDVGHGVGDLERVLDQFGALVPREEVTRVGGQ